MNICAILKSLKKNCLAKKCFLVLWSTKKVSDKEYEYVLNVRNKSEMKKMKYYHDLYLRCDVSLLTNAFEKFRNNSLKNYGLFPSYYLSEPGLSWDEMLKMTKIELEIIPDPDM